jgi:hypothetical protein
MTWLLPLITKLAWWATPKFIDDILDALSASLTLVAAADADPKLTGAAAKRDYVSRHMPGCGTIPEWALRALMECCVILNSLGVTTKQLDKMRDLSQRTPSKGCCPKKSGPQSFIGYPRTRSDRRPHDERISAVRWLKSSSHVCFW